MLNNELLFNNIKKLCDSKNIKVTNLEKELGFGGGIISRWGNNADPSLSKIIDIADYFNISLDVLVGRNEQSINNKFLKTLYELTVAKAIQWLPVDEKTSFSNMFVIRNYNEDQYNETQYYTICEGTSVLIYCFHEYDKMLNPKELSLYIITDKENDEFVPVHQLYTLEELKPLWIEILNSLGECVPSEVKAEKNKQNLINSKEKILLNKMKQYIDNASDNDVAVDKLLDDKNAKKTLVEVDSPELQQLISIFTDPKTMQAMESAQKLIQYFGDIKNIKTNGDNNE